MAKAATSTKKGAKKTQAQPGARKRAASPAEKREGRHAPEPRDSYAYEEGLLDDDGRRTIAGIACVVAAVVLVIIIAWPGQAVVATLLSTALKRLLGVGAILLPILLVAVGATFIARFSEQRVPARAAVGLTMIYVAVMVMFALFTPGAQPGSSVGSTADAMFAPAALESHGGYVGGAIAWAGLQTLGLVPSLVIMLGVVVAGFVVIGFSASKVVAFVREGRGRMGSRTGGEAPQVDAQAGRQPRLPLAGEDDPLGTAETRMLPVSTRRTSGRFADAAAESGGSGQTQQLTRRLGKGAEADDQPTASPARKKKASSTKAVPTQPIADIPDESGFKLPSMKLLKTSRDRKNSRALATELADTAARLQQTMEDFGIMATVVDWVAGPTVTLFEVDLPPGVRVSRVVALNDDIALALAAPGVRIFAPIPGTHYVGIEVPNVTRDSVLLGDVLKDVHGGPLEVAIGKDVEGNAIVGDLAKMPHLLIGGTTGSGKSVGINAMIVSMLMRATPDEVRFIMIDPKRVEFACYEDIPHLYVPVVTEPKEAASALAWAVAEMELRLKTYKEVGVRNITSFNAAAKSGKLRAQVDEGAIDLNKVGQAHRQYIDTPMPYIVIVIDELSDLMMNVGKEVEQYISRIAQLARAAGIHLIVATQRPSANVVTGLIKANITTRIAFMVGSALDSRVILDTNGAESLIGLGDLLLSKPEYAKPLRVQGCFTSDEEIAAVVDAVKSQGAPDYHQEILQTNIMSLGDTMPDGSGGAAESDDPLIWEAAEIVVASGLGSTSNIQRKLKVGYSRAGRIMDMLEEKGVVGPPNGSKPRDVLVDAMELEALKAFEQND